MHPDTDLVIAQLEQVPAFRAQKMAAEHAGIDVKKQVSESLAAAYEILEKIASLFFQKNPANDEAPYVFFLIYDPASRRHNIDVQVGNAAIIAKEPYAFARIISGKVGRR